MKGSELIYPFNEDKDLSFVEVSSGKQTASMTRERMSTTSFTYAFASFKRSQSGVLDVGHAAQGQRLVISSDLMENKPDILMSKPTVLA